MQGMLWLMENPKLDLAEHLRQALTYFQNKHGPATTCWTNPLEPGQDKAQGLGVAVKNSRSILPRHLLIEP